MIYHAEQHVDQVPAHSGEAPSHGAGLHDQDESHRPVLQEVSRAHGVGEHEVPLELRQVFRVDDNVRQAAEPSVDAVDGPVLGQ